MKTRKPGLIVRKSEIRLRGMKKIDSSHKNIIDYGGFDCKLSSNDFETVINMCKQLNESYNDTLKLADKKALSIKLEEQKLSDMYARILSGCVSKFGSDAPEIKLLGGTRKSERKRHNRKKNN
jgi:hypothetical protein